MNTAETASPSVARETSSPLFALIAAEISARGGWMPFVRYQQLALYAPQLGYYTGAARKFGDWQSGGDFVTAPELTPLFGAALARQVREVLRASQPTVLEVGAGSGQLAADLLHALAQINALPERYLILELSAELMARQRATLARLAPQWLARVSWLTGLPERFSGCVVANELLDALPVHAFRQCGAEVFERGVALDECGAGLIWAERTASAQLSAAVAALNLPAVADGYSSEIGLIARAWVGEWGQRLECGALLLIDYGLTQREYYHAQRNGGTLRCHYRQRAHEALLWQPGLSDITSHVDFTALASAAHAAGLDLQGFTAQANFLINCGLGELLASMPATSARHGAVQMLLAPGEMGELFKVMALTRHLPLEKLCGFAQGDRRHAL